jgi:hypothetical protein
LTYFPPKKGSFFSTLAKEDVMSNAIWIIVYDLKNARKEEYLRWFHDVHIPEKLARPGYTWAAHYQVLRDGDEMPSDNGHIGCIALFGGQSTSVFYNPSPAQIKPTQSEETRDMMTCRMNSQSLILSEEWASQGQAIGDDINPAIRADIISLALCNAAGNDEDFGAWLVQDYLKSAGQVPGSIRVRKFLASTGGAKHAIIHERENVSTSPMAFARGENGEWSARVETYVAYPLGQPKTATRLWPVPS